MSRSVYMCVIDYSAAVGTAAAAVAAAAAGSATAAGTAAVAVSSEMNACLELLVRSNHVCYTPNQTVSHMYMKCCYTYTYTYYYIL